MSQPIKNEPKTYSPRFVEPTPRWIRVKVGETIIADSRNALLVIAYDKEYRINYYFPKNDVKIEFFEPSDYTGLNQNYKFWHIRFGGNLIKNAVYTVVNPPDELADIKEYISFKWQSVRWFEEEEEIFVHPKDPYKRVDILQSSRIIKIVIDDVTVAETSRPKVLFETGLPTRYYIPKEDVKSEFLISSSLNTSCPYKGQASYYSVKIGDNVHKDFVWYYPDPINESVGIKGLLAFYNEKVDIYEGGILLERPDSPFK